MRRTPNRTAGGEVLRPAGEAPGRARVGRGRRREKFDAKRRARHIDGGGQGRRIVDGSMAVVAVLGADVAVAVGRRLVHFPHSAALHVVSCHRLAGRTSARAARIADTASCAKTSANAARRAARARGRRVMGVKYASGRGGIPLIERNPPRS